LQAEFDVVANAAASGWNRCRSGSLKPGGRVRIWYQSRRVPELQRCGPRPFYLDNGYTELICLQD